ncbi:cysteine/glutathione ABC transporter ATP-binding protein/permease CydC, partial [Enterobacter cloacae complex sp. ECNIH8]|uniref:ATP-binding cassette domain-containing protein n=1 Tax=Enterobacter cloacae complex sp. ECNIH8 TaxID=2080663 RepID=UPI000D4C3061
DRWREQLDRDEARWPKAQQQQQRLQELSQSLLLLISGATVTLLLWMSAGSPSSGALIALVVFCALAAFEALGPVAGAFLPLAQVIAAAERVTGIIEQTPAIRFPASARCAAGSLSVAIDNVTFRYPHRPEAVLARFSLQVRAGERVALLGPTGCGKSTLLSLLTRAWDTEAGSIALQGIALHSWDEKSLRQRISVVTQRVHLFNQTLRENLRVARPDASDAQLSDVLRQTGLTRLLENEEGLNAWLGEGGRPLSGGELRRLAIARALLHNGDLWLL